MKPSIHPLTAKDLAGIASIWNACFPAIPLSPTSLERQFVEFKLPREGCLVARNGSAVHGFAMATTVQIANTSRAPFPACLPVIAVSRKHRRQGIGAALLRKAEEYLLARKPAKIRLGYPTYLRGTVLSLLGVDTRWTGAIRFFETFGYAPRGALDSMVVKLMHWRMPAEATNQLATDRANGYEFGRLNEADIPEFLESLKDGYTPSWHDQFAHLHRVGALTPSEVLILKDRGKIRGFAGPFHIAENGDTCGVGLGLAPSLRGKGLGMSLLYRILQMVKSSGARQLTLFGAVDKVNYYGKLGLVPDGVWLTMEKIC